MLTGSRVTGSHHAASDYDFLLFVNRSDLRKVPKALNMEDESTHAVIEDLLSEKSNVGCLKTDDRLTSIQVIPKDEFKRMVTPFPNTLVVYRRLPKKSGATQSFTDFKNNYLVLSEFLDGDMKRLKVMHVAKKDGEIKAGIYVDKLIKGTIITDHLGIKDSVDKLFSSYVRAFLFHQGALRLDESTRTLLVTKTLSEDALFNTLHKGLNYSPETKAMLAAKLNAEVAKLVTKQGAIREMRKNKR
ncbi:MAG: hypothetical protein V1817_03410 [Candidatus Micrarchaeota archaeon]